MSWLAITKKGALLREVNDDGSGTGLGRPVDAGNAGELQVIAEHDFGHTVAIDLSNGIVAIDYTRLGMQNGTIELENPKFMFWVCEETNIVGELKHWSQELVFATPSPEENKNRGRPKKYIRDDKGKKVRVKNDILTPVTFRPIWFIRWTNGIPAKVIGVQVTLPKEQGGRNVKKLITLFSDGRIGMD